MVPAESHVLPLADRHELVSCQYEQPEEFVPSCVVPIVETSEPIIVSNALYNQLLAYEEHDPADPPRFYGDPKECQGFLKKCLHYIPQNAACFPSDRVKVGYIMSCLAGDALMWICPLWEAGDPVVMSLGAFLVAFRKVFDMPRPAALEKSSPPSFQRQTRQEEPVGASSQPSVTVPDTPVPQPAKSASCVRSKRSKKKRLASLQSQSGLVKEHPDGLCPVKPMTVSLSSGSFGVYKPPAIRNQCVVSVVQLPKPAWALSQGGRALLENSLVLQGQLQLQVGALYMRKFIFHLLTGMPMGHSDPEILVPVYVWRPSRAPHLKQPSDMRCLVPLHRIQSARSSSSPGLLVAESRCEDAFEEGEVVSVSSHIPSDYTSVLLPRAPLPLDCLPQDKGLKMDPEYMPSAPLWPRGEGPKTELHSSSNQEAVVKFFQGNRLKWLPVCMPPASMCQVDEEVGTVAYVSPFLTLLEEVKFSFDNGLKLDLVNMSSRSLLSDNQEEEVLVPSVLEAVG